MDSQNTAQRAMLLSWGWALISSGQLWIISGGPTDGSEAQESREQTDSF